MPRSLFRCSLLALAAMTWAFAQRSATPEFDAVTVKPSPPPGSKDAFPGSGCYGGPGFKDPTLFRCNNTDLATLIIRAYGVPRFLLTAPDSIRDQRFELTAKVPEGASKDDVNLMLRNMLVERFKLTVHHESKEAAKYDLVAAKGGAKLKEHVDEPPPPPPTGPTPLKLDNEGYPILGPYEMMSSLTNGKTRAVYPKWTMAQFASQVASTLGKPVTDATGLTGTYDLSLHWQGPSQARPKPAASEDPAAGASLSEEPGPTFEQALADQLGLRLEARKGPADFLVVDHFEKLPTDN